MIGNEDAVGGGFHCCGLDAELSFDLLALGDFLQQCLVLNRQFLRPFLDTLFQFVMCFAECSFHSLALSDIVYHPGGANNLTGFISEVFALFINDAHLGARPFDNAVLDFVAVPAFAY